MSRKGKISPEEKVKYARQCIEGQLSCSEAARQKTAETAED